mgnify:CR=1 FL=1
MKGRAAECVKIGCALKPHERKRGVGDGAKSEADKVTFIGRQ